MRIKLGLVLLFGALALSPNLAFASDDKHSLEQLVIEMVDSPTEHAALANYYRTKAAEARAEASHHASMAHGYSLQKRGAMDQMVAHCNNIAANSTAAATKYDRLANLHEAESKTVK